MKKYERLADSAELLNAWLSCKLRKNQIADDLAVKVMAKVDAIWSLAFQLQRESASR